MIYQPHKGFIALMSVIIISAILLVLVFTLGTSSFFHRFDVLDTENKRVSLGLAEACASAAMLKIAQDASYSGGTLVTVDATNSQKVCKICAFTSSLTPTIPLKAKYNGAYTNLSVTINATPGNFAITNWVELASNPSCSIP